MIMDIVKGIVLVLHLLCFGALLGTTITQFKPAGRGQGVISKGMLHSANGLLVTGILLVALTYALGSEPNNLKIGIKMLVLLVIFGLIIFFRKKPATPAILGAISALLVLNVALAVIW